GTAAPTGGLAIQGNVGIGTTNPDSIKLDVEDDIEIGTGTTGCVRDADNTTLVGSCVSDEQLKKNITALPAGTLDKLSQLNPVTFEWRNDEYSWLNGQVGTNYGLIAQEVEQVFPEMVHTDDRGYKRVSYDIGLTMRLLAGIKELDLKVNELGSFLEPPVPVSEVDGDSSITSFFKAITAKFSDIYGVIWENGIMKIAHVIADKLTVKELCLEEVCINKEQLKQLLEQNNVNSVSNGGGSSADEEGENSPLEETPASDEEGVSDLGSEGGGDSETPAEEEEETPSPLPDSAPASTGEQGEEATAEAGQVGGEVEEEETPPVEEETITEESAPEPVAEPEPTE
ncbi:hypothetical protein COW82_02910, partial [Candidatus Campbellbacteria bacterium CG22_combo_CG10-13_8_21_14_all_43_18]